MQMDSFVASAGGNYEVKPVSSESKGMVSDNVVPSTEVKTLENVGKNTGTKQNDVQEQQRGREKEPAQSSMDAAMSMLNAQIANTHCSYSYDEDTKRISIKVFDDETDELIREIPPEKSLEALKKMWEIAGIMIDKKL